MDMVRQRVFGIALGCEDLNDHADLRLDPGLQGATGLWPARRRCAASRTGPSEVGRGRFTRFW